MNRPFLINRREFAIGLLAANAPGAFAQLTDERSGRGTATSFLVHISSSESREIHAFVMDAQTGGMELLEVVAVPGTGAPTRGNIPLAWDQNHEILYAQNRIAPFPLSAFALDSRTGKLRLIETVPMASPMAYLSLTRDGRHLLAASYDDAQLTVNRLEADGRVVVPSQQSVSTPPKPHCILEAPVGGLVFATTLDGDAILVFQRDVASGELKLRVSNSTRKGTGPRHLAFHPTLSVLYSLNEYAGSVTAFWVNYQTGDVRELQYESLVKSPLPNSAAGADIHLSPDARYVYASVRRTDEITRFRVDATTGLLSNGVAFKVESFPRGFNIDPTGRFLLCAGQNSNHVGVYAVDRESGELVLRKRVLAGKRPSWIEFTPWAATSRL